MVRQSLMFIKLRLIELFRQDSLRVLILLSPNSRRYWAISYRPTILYGSIYILIRLPALSTRTSDSQSIDGKTCEVLLL